MPDTSELIEQLSRDLAPISSDEPMRRLLFGLGAGVLTSFIGVYSSLGLRKDLLLALASEEYWVKFAYPLVIGICGFVLVLRLGRPGARLGSSWLVIIAAVATVTMITVAQLIGATPATSKTLLLGNTALECPWLILLASLPILAGGIWGMEGLAPTRLTFSGLMVGVMAGGLGAWVYALHCPESAIPFVAVWYTAGVGMVAAMGAVVGKMLLRW
jgi:hypothetical protein